MILSDLQIRKLLNLRDSERVLDVGGSMRQHEEINVDTITDFIRPEDSPYDPSVLKAKHFVKVDVTRDRLPFKDKEFDVCLCTHTLEDLPNPFLIMEEMSRVAKRGLIVTPSMGYDMVFTPIDYTDWLTGAKRVPGEAHHKWFFINKGKTLEVIPKYYGILYTPEFQISEWNGEREMVYVWKNKINYSEFNGINIHRLIDRYKKFINTNKKYIKKSRALFFVDSPWNMAKAILKKILKRGNGYKYRKAF